MSDPFDRTKIAELFEMIGGDVTWIDELLELYIKNTAEELAALTDLLDEGDTTAVARKTHTIKGTSGNVGAHQMFELCLKANRHAQQGELTSVRALLPELREAHEATARDKARVLAFCASS